jgi:VIT1/CCC1 family predicted Fe2+/Mn2+ transporter
VITFLAFCTVGMVPLLPFVLTPQAGSGDLFALSSGLTASAFFGVGMLKGRLLDRPPLRAGLRTLVIGGTAAALAYAVGVLLRDLAGPV